ncbi:hypothetical protein ZWY2020_050306 [Hordeum vulgare]|nr:hypothetical protein ZWY2020_050306 [Hordeum vulgare]
MRHDGAAALTAPVLGPPSAAKELLDTVKEAPAALQLTAAMEEPTAVHQQQDQTKVFVTPSLQTVQTIGSKDRALQHEPEDNISDALSVTNALVGQEDHAVSPGSVGSDHQHTREDVQGEDTDAQWIPPGELLLLYSPPRPSQVQYDSLPGWNNLFDGGAATFSSARPSNLPNPENRCYDLPPLSPSLESTIWEWPVLQQPLSAQGWMRPVQSEAPCWLPGCDMSLFHAPQAQLSWATGPEVVFGPDPASNSIRRCGLMVSPLENFATMMAARELWEMEELVEEILIRIPPEEPAVLVRASLACKPWCRLLSGKAFRSRYCALHKTPPILGFLQSWEDNVERFVPTTNFRPRNSSRRDFLVHDCRHGRVLLESEWDEAEVEKEDEGEEADKEEEEEEDGMKKEDSDAEQEEEDEDEGGLKLVVWDPVSGSRTKLHAPDMFDPDINGTTFCWGSVLCAADGCNHAACNLGPFFVVLIGLDIDEPYDDDDDDDDKRLVWASLYSSETREWTSPPDSIHVGGSASMVGRPRVLVGQALHFLFHDDGLCILKYDLGANRLSVIDLRGMGVCGWDSLLISTEGSKLGLLHIGMDKLCFMWLVEVSVDGVASWIQLREMDLKMLVPICDPMGLFSLKLVGCVEGTEIIIVVTVLGAFTIDLKSSRLRKLSSKPHNFAFLKGVFDNLFLYTSFNSPPAVAGAVAVAGTISK